MWCMRVLAKCGPWTYYSCIMHRSCRKHRVANEVDEYDDETQEILGIFMCPPTDHQPASQTDGLLGPYQCQQQRLVLSAQCSIPRATNAALTHVSMFPPVRTSVALSSCELWRCDCLSAATLWTIVQLVPSSCLLPCFAFPLRGIRVWSRDSFSRARSYSRKPSERTSTCQRSTQTMQTDNMLLRQMR